MALTLTQKTEAYQFFIVAFGAAPGVEYMNQLNDAYGAGMTTKQIVNVYATKPQFEAQYPRFLTNEQFADKLINNVVGASATDAAKVEAKADVAAALNAGWSKGDVVFQIFTNLAAKASTDAQWGNTSKLLANKVAVSAYVTETLLVNTTDLAKLGALLTNVTQDAASVDAAKAAALSANGQTFTLTNSIDNRTGTAGNDTFIGDNTSVNAADTINGGAGNDLVKLYNTVSLPNLTGVESLQINGHEGNVNAASIADLTSVELKDVTLTADGAPTYTVAGTQTLTITNVKDSDEDNTDGVEINAAASVTAQSIKLNAAGDAATGGIDLNIDINGTGVATLNVDSSTAASRVAIQNTGAAIRTLNITGDAAVTIEAESGANNVGALATAISITNTAGASVVSSAAPSATTGLVITAVGGKDTVTLAQAAGANALTNKTSVDLGAGDDTLVISKLTAATDIADGASFKGGDGVDTLKLFDGDIIDATRGKLFSGFETVDVGGAQATTNLNLALLAANNTIGTLKLSAANTGAVNVTNLAETAGVVINAATGAALTINQKDSGAGSPDDVINVTYDSKTAIGAQTGATTIADIETVNLNVTSTGTNITHEVTTLVVNNATKVTLNASTAAVDIKAGFSATSLVLLDASASVKNTKIALNDAYTATAGVAVKGGAGVDTLDFTDATTGAATEADLDFVITGNGGADVITLAAVTEGVDRIVYLAQGDSTAAKYDSITNFDATAASAQDLLDLKAFGFTGNQVGVKDFAASDSITLAADGTLTVASGSLANFFVDAGLARGVATWDGGTDTFVLVDANKDGNFSSADDLVIKLVGVGTSSDITATDIVFA